MTSISLPAAYVASPLLPAVCARHGGPSTRTVKRKFFTPTPGWVFLICLLSLLIGAIIAIAIRTTVTCALPACERCRRDRRRFVASVWGTWVLTLLSLGAGRYGPFIFLALALGSLIWSFAGGSRTRVTGAVSKDKSTVTLKNVDEGFATAAWARMLETAPPGAVAVPSS